MKIRLVVVATALAACLSIGLTQAQTIPTRRSSPESEIAPRVLVSLTEADVVSLLGRTVPKTVQELTSFNFRSEQVALIRTVDGGMVSAGVMPTVSIGLPPASLTGGQVWVYTSAADTGVLVLLAENQSSDGWGNALTFVAAKPIKGARTVFEPTLKADVAWIVLFVASDFSLSVARHQVSASYITGERQDTKNITFYPPNKPRVILELNGLGSMPGIVHLDGVALAQRAGTGIISFDGLHAEWVGFYNQPAPGEEGLVVAARLNKLGVIESTSRWAKF